MKSSRRDQLVELVVISGKGGTGKTSITASLALLARSAVVADCDVDAADLHLILQPQLRERHPFISGHEAVIRAEDCVSCGLCLDDCRFGAIEVYEDDEEEERFRVDPLRCEGCGVCVRFCPAEAIEFPERTCGEWFVSESRCGPMVHARLGIAAENSGKLVSTVRHQARRVAEELGAHLMIIDGPPGVGCPVIASVTGASLALVVTEPTVAGIHDLERVLALTNHFRIPTAVCVNKWDINPEMAEQVEAAALNLGVRLAGRIRYDSAFSKVQSQARAVVETRTAAADDIRFLWHRLQGIGREHGLLLQPLVSTTGEDTMRIAVPVVNGKLSAHFGHCETFALIDADPQAKSILQREDVAAPPHEPGLLPGWLAERGANVIIAGGIGGRAQSLFVERGISVVAGAPAETPERLASAYLAGTLQHGRNTCDH